MKRRVLPGIVLGLCITAGVALPAGAATVTRVKVLDSVASPLPIPGSLHIGDTFAKASTPTTFEEFFQFYLPKATKDSWSVTALSKSGQAGLSSLTSALYLGQVSSHPLGAPLEAGLAMPASKLPPNYIGNSGALITLAPGWYTLEVRGTTLTKAGADLGGSFGGTLTISPVPEPETYALMLSGLGVLGAVARRRRSAAR